MKTTLAPAGGVGIATICLLVLASALLAVPTAHGQIFVTNVFGTPQTIHGSIGEYNLDGSVINPALVTPGSPLDITIVGSNLYVANGGGEFAGSIDQYTTSGATIASPLTSFYAIHSLAVSGTNLFVGYSSDTGRVGKYTTAGDTVDDSFITGLQSAPFGIAVTDDGSKLFVADYYGETVGEYNAQTGAAIDASLITGLNLPTGIAIAGSKLYVANSGNGTIGEYNLDGSVVNAALITGFNSPLGIFHLAVFDGDLFVADGPTGSVGEYDAASGATINSTLITGLSEPQGIAVVPEPATWLLMAIGIVAVLSGCRFDQPICAISIGREWDVFAVDFAEGVLGGVLFGFFFVATPGGLVALGADLSGDFEALAVIGAFFVEQRVGGGGAEIALGQLLQERFVIAAEFAGDGGGDFRSDEAMDKIAGGRLTAVEINGGGEGLENVG
jgi:hypothetical protein